MLCSNSSESKVAEMADATSMSAIDVTHFINGEFVSSSDGGTFDLFSPYNGDLVARVSEGTDQDVDRAVAAAQAAQPAWSSLSPQERGRPLRRLAELITAAKDELATLDALSLGRPVDTYFDSHYASMHFNYFSEAAYPVGSSSLNTPGFLNMSLRQPYGVGAAIIPWNCPLVFFSKKLAPALAAGNTMLVKTSEKAPTSCHRVAQMLTAAGFPPGVVNVVHGHGPRAGAAMSAHMQIRALSFTGSVATGRAIQRAAAASNFKHLVFELGGKTPAVVFADADVERAARETQHSIMWHNGQTCMANSRIYVHAAVAERFVAEFNAVAARRRLGDPAQPGVDNGPMADRTQCETVRRYIAEGARTGEMLLPTARDAPEGGGHGEEHLFVGPVVFLQQPRDASVMREEIFGPVACINTFDTEEEALAMANDSEYGLYAAVYTRDIDRAVRIATRFEAGMVAVNCTSPTGSWDMPFGGFKQSGVGREGFLHSLEDWMEEKTVYIKVDGLGGGAQPGARQTFLGR